MTVSLRLDAGVARGATIRNDAGRVCNPIHCASGDLVRRLEPNRVSPTLCFRPMLLAERAERCQGRCRRGPTVATPDATSPMPQSSAAGYLGGSVARVELDSFDVLDVPNPWRDRRFDPADVSPNADGR
jgi:hypothetical protein